MNPEMIVSNQTEDFFAELFENRWSKILAIVTSGFTTLTGLILIYSIIWFERYGSDDKRTLQVNKSIKHVLFNFKGLGVRVCTDIDIDLDSMFSITEKLTLKFDSMSMF
jgi:hypothetical protein